MTADRYEDRRGSDACGESVPKKGLVSCKGPAAVSRDIKWLACFYMFLDPTRSEREVGDVFWINEVGRRVGHVRPC